MMSAIAGDGMDANDGPARERIADEADLSW